MTMPAISMLFGFLLAVVGVAGYSMSGAGSMTALIPAFFGVGLYVCGRVGLAAPSARKHAMHVAAALALVAVVGGLGMSLPRLPAALAGEVERPMAVWLSLAMGVLALIFVALCVKSFIDARKSRAA